MQEQEIAIPLSESGHMIYGTLRGDYKHPLIVLCHGYGGWMHEMLMYNAARYFEKEGFATLRLSMYGGGENSRNISESDVVTHAADIDDAVAYAKKSGAEWIGIIGHSYSGMAIVYSEKQQFDAAALWDPSHTDGYDDPEAFRKLEGDFTRLPELHMYVSGLGSGYVYAQTVFENDYPKSHEMAGKFKVPTLVVNASWSESQQRYGKDYADTIVATTERVVIPDSSHPFTEDGAAEKLFATSANYFKKFI